MSDTRQSPQQQDEAPRLGVVVIGRNEGERLVRCLASLSGFDGPVVYVDSGSTDRSVQVARDAGADVVELSTDRPFTAARARNEGAERLASRCPGLSYVQFVDGDCEIDAAWLLALPGLLDADPQLAAVSGRLRERDGHTSRVRRLCDMEWRRPPGEATHCGGVFACRLDLFSAVGGFDPAVTAGEEPELCARMRARGGRIVRVDRHMGVHDSGMSRIGEWWRRAARGGAAQMANARRLGDAAAWRETLSAGCWGAVVPLAALSGLVVALWWPPALLLTAVAVAATLAQFCRIARHRRRLGDSPADARLYAQFCLLGKIAQTQGALFALAGGEPEGPPARTPQPEREIALEGTNP